MGNPKSLNVRNDNSDKCTKIRLVRQFVREPQQRNSGQCKKNQNKNVLNANLDIYSKGYRSKDLLDIAKEIWDYLIPNHITITAEYLPSALHYQTDWQSSN